MAQCDGEIPCKRCKDDGLVCTAGVRKKTEYKQLPPGYAEVLENSQFALVATVQKLFSMVQSRQPWVYGEPELNERGQPVVHDIASKLGCIRPTTDVDLPVQSVFPEDEADLAELARQLEERRREAGFPATGNNTQTSIENDSLQDHSPIRRTAGQETEPSSCNRTDRASSLAASSDPDLSEMEQDYRRAAFGSGGTAATVSPASVTYNDFDIGGPVTQSPGILLPPDFPWGSAGGGGPTADPTPGDFVSGPPPPPQSVGLESGWSSPAYYLGGGGLLDPAASDPTKPYGSLSRPQAEVMLYNAWYD